MKNSIRYKINRLIALAVISISIVLVGLSMTVVSRFTNATSNALMMDEMDAQVLRLNSQQEKIEQAVFSVYEISKYISDDHFKLQTDGEIESYLDLFRETAITVATSIDEAVSVYYRLSPEYVGEGAQGFFYIKSNDTGAFYRQELTDILAYDEDDKEHVGWYYIPIKTGHGVWLAPYYNANVGFEMISYVMPMFDGDIPMGVVGIDIDFNKLVSTAEAVDTFDSSGANLVDLDSKRVYYNQCDLFGNDLSDELVSLLSSGEKSSSPYSLTVDGNRYKLYYATLNNGMKLMVYAQNSDIHRVSITILAIGIAIFFIFFLLTLMIAIRTSNRIVGPITSINETTKEYAKGNWDASLSCNTGDELQELTESILDMAAVTKNNISHLQDAMVVAQEASKAKSTFLSNMSHDIRTPMNAIITYSRLAISQPGLQGKTKEYLELILQASNHLLALINSVLEMSRIESGKTQINVIPCNIKELVHELKAMVYANAEEKHQTILIDTSGIVNENIMCDSLRFNQVMINLLGNAVKFTGEGGTITVTASEEASNTLGESLYHFAVKDTGIGISEEFMANLFNPFEREANSTVSGIQGTGLGLAITKNLIEMMGGRISVNSKKGEGTSFFIDIGFAHSTLAGESAEESGTCEATIDLGHIDLSNIKILLAEDNKVNRLIVKELLGKKVALIDEAVNGREAVEKLVEKGEGYYSVILMDVQMPEMDGYEATRTIRALHNKGLADIPIIAMTANAFEEDKRNALNAGMNAHLTKPIDVEALTKTLGLLPK